MKKPTGKGRISLPFDYMPELDEQVLSSVRKTITERVAKMHAHRSLLNSLQAELTRNQQYSPRLSREAFRDIHLKLRSDFDAFFFRLSPDAIFSFFDEDGDGYLSEDEQLLLFTVLVALFYHLLEETSFYSLYDLDPLIRTLINLATEAVVALEKNLRNAFYREQRGRLEKLRAAKVAQLSHIEQAKLAAHEEMRMTKEGQFSDFQTREEARTLAAFGRKKTLTNFNKFADLRHFLVQEKLLGLSGHNEEAKNTLRNLNLFLDRELERMQRGAAEAFRHASANFQRRCEFKRSVLEKKVLSEQEKIRGQQRDRRALLEKTLDVFANKMAIEQQKATAQSAFNFQKNCRINLVKSENALKKDYALKINSNLKSIYREEVIHSRVFRAVFQDNKLSLLHLQNDADFLETLAVARDSPFNVRLSLRNLDDKPMPVNAKGQATFRRSKLSVAKAWGEKGHPIMDNNALRLTLLYDDNLREVRTPQA